MPPRKPYRSSVVNLPHPSRYYSSLSRSRPWRGWERHFAPQGSQVAVPTWSADISVEIGDPVDVTVSGAFALMCVVFNTLFNVLTQEEPVRCLANAATHLTDKGVFVVEAYTPSTPG